MTTTERNHGRAADKTQTSIAVPKALLDAIQRLADSETRTRNNMIEVLLTEAVKSKSPPGDTDEETHSYKPRKRYTQKQ